jgi:hypothetical protein
MLQLTHTAPTPYERISLSSHFLLQKFIKKDPAVPSRLGGGEIPNSTESLHLEGDRLWKTLFNLWKTSVPLWKPMWNLWGKLDRKIRIAKFFQLQGRQAN